MFKISLNVLKNFICLMICYRIGLENPIVMEMQTVSTHFFLQCTSRVSPIVK